MILAVDAVSGHYTIPGPSASGSGGLMPSYPIAPPSTIRGFLESLCGKSRGTFAKVEFTYGYRKEPEGRGNLLRKCAVWSSSGHDGSGEGFRPLHYDTLVGVSYWIEVVGMDAELQDALQGKVERNEGGPLYLGESFDLVTSVREVLSVDSGATKVVPGRTLVMPWVSGCGFGNRNAELRAWDIVPFER